MNYPPPTIEILQDISMGSNSLTVMDLYNAIDWSGTTEVLSNWKKDYPEDILLKEEDNTSFLDNFRQTLLAYALPKEIVGELPEGNEEKMQSARWALHAAGVWQFVVDWLIAQDLLGVVRQEQLNQLDLFTSKEINV